jgi:hypothetical protein
LSGQGAARYRWNYEGGTYAENAELAGINGCSKPFAPVEDVSFCCPMKPFVHPL